MAEPLNPRNPTKVSDEQLASIARGGEPRNEILAEIAAELLRYRRIGRADSRRADQVKRLRWQAENLTSKVEELRDRARELSTAHEGETLDEFVAFDDLKDGSAANASKPL